MLAEAGRRAAARSLVAIGVAVALPAYGASGGPDAFGYTFADTASGGPTPAYEFATTNALAMNNDGSAAAVLPFPFVFYGESYTSMRVHANGGITFGGDASDLSYQHDCPLPAPPRASIFPYWTDLEPASTSIPSGIYVDTVGVPPERRVIVEWFELPHYESTGVVTFEVKLFESDGHVEVHYVDTDLDGSAYDDGKAAAIAIAPAGGTPLAAGCDTPAVTGGTALGFYPPACDDADGDGFCADDCNEGDPDVHPGAPEACNGEDDDCSGAPGVDEVDDDGDGYRLCDDDCDDTDAALSPADTDGDGWSSCLGDCDDEDAARDDIDHDGDGLSACDGDCDDTDAAKNFLDEDGDGRVSCVDDCDDLDPLVRPGAAELCDQLDNDCDGETDENPNCAGDDDDDASVAVPWGCFVSCGYGGRAAAPWAAVLLVPFLRRRRA